MTSGWLRLTILLSCVWLIVISGVAVFEYVQWSPTGIDLDGRQWFFVYYSDPEVYSAGSDGGPRFVPLVKDFVHERFIRMALWPIVGMWAVYFMGVKGGRWVWKGFGVIGDVPPFSPIIISVALLVVAALFALWMSGQDMENKDHFSLLISTVATTGALISAVFLIYGYLVNLSAFKESQKPRLLLQVHNGRANLNSTGQDVHMTIIAYSNVSTIECKGMELYAQLVNEKESIDIPRLFSCPMNLLPNDSRTRDFPTKAYLSDNGVAQYVIDNLEKYRLRVGYRYRIMGETVESNYDYAWNQNREWWSIA